MAVVPAATGELRITAGERDEFRHLRARAKAAAPRAAILYIGKIRIMKSISRHRWTRCWPLAVVLLAACASSPTQKSPTPVVGARSGNADELAARALTTWATDRAGASQALAQIRQAVESAPQRPDLLWLNARICTDVPGCEPSAIEAQLRNLDPGNGAVWIGPLLRAQARKDARAADEKDLQGGHRRPAYAGGAASSGATSTSDRE